MPVLEGLERMNSKDLSRRGAYGIALDGVPGAEQALSPAPPEADLWTITRRSLRPQPPEDDVVTDHFARFVVYGGTVVEVDASSRQIALSIADSEPDESITHPYMVGACTLAAWWRGALVFHAGSIVIDGRAWGILGAKQAGKSTLVAAMDAAGVTVLADDITVVEGGQAFCGPRFIDLRRAQAEHYPQARAIGRAGARSRWRLPLGPAPWSAPLAGWITLAWGEELALRSVPALNRLEQLGLAYGLSEPPTDPRTLLDAATLPMHELQRPRDMAQMPKAIELLTRRLSAAD